MPPKPKKAPGSIGPKSGFIKSKTLQNFNKSIIFHPWNSPNYQILAILAIIHFRILVWHIYLVKIHSRSPNWLWNSWCNNIILKRWPLTDKAKLLKFAGFWNMDNFYGRRWKFLFWLISDPLYYRGSKNTNLTSVQFRKGKAVAPATCEQLCVLAHIGCTCKASTS